MIKSKKIMSLFGASAIVLIFSGVLGLITIPGGAGTLIIKFGSISEGPDLLGSKGIFIGLLGIMLVILAINFILALDIFPKDNFLSYTLATTTLIVSLIFLLVVSIISSIN